MMQLSLWSRTTSISNSFQPITDSSSSTSLVGRGIEAARHDVFELLAVVGDAAAAAAEGERRADHHRVADLAGDRQRLLEAAGDLRLRRIEADLAHGVAEQLAVLGHVDRRARGGDQLDVVLLEHPLAHQVERGVERGLAAHGGQQRVGPLLLDDARHACAQLTGSM